MLGIKMVSRPRGYRGHYILMSPDVLLSEVRPKHGILVFVILFGLVLG